jgi:hypothetical protein
VGNVVSGVNYTTTCTSLLTSTPESGPSQGFSFTTHENLILDAEVTSFDGGSPLLSLTQGCGASEVESSCSDSFLIGLASISGPLPAGSYNLRVTGGPGNFILGTAGGTGEYQLQVSLAEPVANDTCAGVLNLPLTNGQGSVVVDTSSATNDTVTSPAGACTQDDGTGSGARVGFGNGGDVVYSVTLPGPGNHALRAVETPQSGSGIAPVLSIRSGPNCINNFSDAGASGVQELGCMVSPDAGANTVTVQTAPLAAGTYYIWVDAWSGTAGPVQLSVTVL